MNIVHFLSKESQKNLSYLICFRDNFAICIDPFNGLEINEFLIHNRLKLDCIINTHEHWDHILGNEVLLEHHVETKVLVHPNNLQIIPNSIPINFREKIELDSNYYLEFFNSPGHTFGHVCVLLKEFDQIVGVFSGDTVFCAGVGNCKKGGEISVLSETIKQILHLVPNFAILYPGHDYQIRNLEFTINKEPDNFDAQILLGKKQNNLNSLHFTNMELEKKINLFFKAFLANKEQSEVGRNKFIFLRKERDNW